MADHDLTSLEAIRARMEIGEDDTRLDDLIRSFITPVSQAVEMTTGRWFAPRGPLTLYFDGSRDRCELAFHRGIRSVSSLSIATSHQPDDGSGTYAAIASADIYLDPPAYERETEDAPATRIVLVRGSFPRRRTKRSIKLVSDELGWAACPARPEQIVQAAIIRAVKAKSSGGADYAIVGPDGGMKILRDFAPAELEELLSKWAPLISPGRD